LSRDTSRKVSDAVCHANINVIGLIGNNECIALVLLHIVLAVINIDRPATANNCVAQTRLRFRSVPMIRLRVLFSGTRLACFAYVYSVYGETESRNKSCEMRTHVVFVLCVTPIFPTSVFRQQFPNRRCHGLIFDQRPARAFRIDDKSSKLQTFEPNRSCKRHCDLVIWSTNMRFCKAVKTSNTRKIRFIQSVTSPVTNHTLTYVLTLSQNPMIKELDTVVENQIRGLNFR